jgi:hypothetical protein
MRNQLFVAAAAALLLVCPRQAWSSERASAVTTEICRLESDVTQAIVTRNGGVLTSLFADEYEHTNYFGSVADKKAEINFFTSTDFAIKGASITDCAVHVYQDVAVATGVDIWTEASYRGRDLSGSYRFTRVYVHRKGRWQIVASHASKIPPA